MAVCLEQSTPILHHHPFYGGVDLLLLSSWNEKVDFWWILFQPSKWASSHDGDHNFQVAHVISWCENNQATCNKPLGLLPTHELADAS